MDKQSFNRNCLTLSKELLFLQVKENDDELTGVSFEDLGNEKYAEIKKLFWRYQMPIEYIDTEDRKNN